MSVALPPRASGRFAKRSRLEVVSADAEDADKSGESSGHPVFSPNYTTKEACYEYLDHTADVQIHAWGDTLADAFAQCALGMFGYMTDVPKISVDASIHGGRVIEAKGHDPISLLFAFLDSALFAFAGGESFLIKDMSVEAFKCSFDQIKRDDGEIKVSTSPSSSSSSSSSPLSSSGGDSNSSSSSSSSSSGSASAASSDASASSASSDGSVPFYVRARCWGEIWDPKKHPQGTEIKAITYSNMQIFLPGAQTPYSANATNIGTFSAGADSNSSSSVDGGGSSAAAAGNASAPPAPFRKGQYDVFVIVDI